MSNFGHLENPKYKFVATGNSSSSSAQGLFPSKKQDSPKEDKNHERNGFTTAPTSTTKSIGGKEPDLLDDLLQTLSKSPPAPVKVVTPFYKPSSSSNSNSIIFTPATNSSAFDLNVFPSIGSNYFASMPAATSSSYHNDNTTNASINDSKTQLQSINANFGPSKIKDSAAENGKNDRTGGSGPAATKARYARGCRSLLYARCCNFDLLLYSFPGLTRCSKVVLAGTAISRGLKSSAFSKCACDNLRCLQCNFTGLL